LSEDASGLPAGRWKTETKPRRAMSLSKVRRT
jgi:hypothetical protein